MRSLGVKAYPVMLILSLLLASTGIVAAQSKILSEAPTRTRISTPTSTASNACAAVASLALDGDVDAYGYVDIPAATAFACLTSVPVDVEGDAQLIDELKLLWQWQSEIGYLKNTPSEWEFGALDAESELDKIKQNLTNFASEYDVQVAIQDIVLRSGNFHWNYEPDILNVFIWARPVDVASISDDGVSLPKLYDSNDTVILTSDSSAVSAITQINGEDAYTYLNMLGTQQQYIDSDGRLNAMVHKGDTGNLGGFILQYRYDGPSTKFSFANNSDAEYDNIAMADPDLLDWASITDARSFFKECCTDESTSPFGANTTMNHQGRRNYAPRIPSASSRQSTSSIRRRQLNDDPFISYPEAEVMDDDYTIAGFFLNQTGYEDVAVLKIISFEPADEEGFQSAVSEFFSKCVAAKKQKLVIDLRENGGGEPELALDTFMQLFPNEQPYAGHRYRAQDQYTKIGDAVSEIYTKGLTEDYGNVSDSTLDNDFRYWAYWNFVKPAGDNFQSWTEYEGPQVFNSDNFTAVDRYNLSDANQGSVLEPGFEFSNNTGSGPFDASNIVMFTDALCGSACEMFHEELKNIAGVKAVVVGGRPNATVMQTITGSKGGEVIPISDLTTFAIGIISVASDLNLNAKFEGTSVEQLANVTQVITRAGSDSRVQVFDQMRKGDTSGTPLQYIYDAADCRFFYTATSYIDPTAAWQQAWDAFQDDKKCVQGSTGHPSSISGGFKPFGTDEVTNNGTATGNGGNSNTKPSGSPTSTNAAGKPKPSSGAVRLSGSAVVGAVLAAAVALL